MTAQDDFKRELQALLSKYNVEVQVEENTSGYTVYPEGVNFFSYAEYDHIRGEEIRGAIDFTLGTWFSSSSFS